MVKRVMAFSVVTNHPIALDSLDHLHPAGSARDNTQNRSFNANVTHYMKSHLSPRDRPLRVLDIGCAGGAFVKTMMEDGWDAVGIEGSDYNLLNGQFHWPELMGRNLFTADATREYYVLWDRPDNMGMARIQFDLITAWEVMEHIQERDLYHFLWNVKTNLADDGLFICSITSVDCPHGFLNPDGSPGNVDLHVTCRSHGWWLSRMEEAGFIARPDISDAIGRERIRYGTMTHVGPQCEATRTNYGDNFHCGNYVFTKI